MVITVSVSGIHFSLCVYGFSRIDFGGRSLHSVLIPYLRNNHKVQGNQDVVRLSVLGMNLP